MPLEGSRIPRVAALLSPEELRRLPLTPIDGFVLSRVDGQSSFDDIVGHTGLPEQEVAASLERLANLSLVVLDASAERAPARTVSSTIESPRTAEARPKAAPPTPPASAPRAVPSEPRVMAKVEAPNDLSPEEQKRIVEAMAFLDTADHYALLGVPRAADKKEIKRGYYERAALYHPDRYFRRQPGDYKPMLEAIFARITAAHDVLTDKVQRADYDSYLGDRAHTEDLETRLKAAEATVRAAEAAAREAPAITTPEPSPSPFVTTPPPAPAPSPAVAAAALRDAAERAGQASPKVTARPASPIDPQARRDLLAKHLRGGKPTRTSSNPGFAAATSPPPPQADKDALRRRYEQRKEDVRRGQAQHHRQTGDQARAAGDAIAAAASYKAALNFTPEDSELQRLVDEATVESETTLADTYRKQAIYEEKAGRWADAARSWSKVTQLAPKDPVPWERAANSILLAKGNLHDAATFAQKATSLLPQDARLRALLSNVYLEAGLFKNAKREIDTAIQLAPGDDSIAVLARRIASAIGK